MSRPDKIYLNFPENKQVDETGLSDAISTPNLFHISLGSKKTLNIQLYNADGTPYSADFPAAKFICDKDYKNHSPLFPVGEIGWTQSGSEYYKSLEKTPVNVYFNLSPAIKGTIGSLETGQYAYDSENKRIYVRLSGDLNPAEQAEAYITYKIAVDGATDPFISSSRFNESGSWYDSGSDSMIDPDISQGQVSFFLNANTVQFYERLEAADKQTCFAEIQFFNSSGEIVDIKKITVICHNKLNDSVNIELPESKYMPREEIAAAYLSHEEMNNVIENVSISGTDKIFSKKDNGQMTYTTVNMLMDYIRNNL